MSFVTSLYRKFLEQEELPAVLQHRAYHTFMLEKDEVGLAKLAGHPALVEEIDELLGKHKSAKVRTSWAARPNRTIEELEVAFAKEKRVTVLEIGAQMANMPDAWYDIVLRADSATIAAHVLRHDGVGLATQKKAAAVYARYAAGNARLIGSMAVLFAGKPELYDTIAENAHGSVKVLRFVAGAKLKPANQRLVLERAIYPYLVPASGERYARYEQGSRMQRTMDVAMLFAKQPANLPELRAELHQKVAALDMTGYDQRQQEAAKAVLETLRSDPAEVIDVLTLAATTTNQEKLVELVNTARADHDSELALAIATNKAVVSKTLLRAAEIIPWGNRREIFQVHAANADNAAALLCQGSYYWSGDDVLDLCSEPGLVLEMVMETTTKDGGRIPGWILESKHLRIEMLEKVAFHAIAEAPLSANAVKQLMQLVTEQLEHAHPDAWKVFESVANSSGASLADVIAATQVLAAP